MMARLTLLCCGMTEANRTGAFPLDEPLEPRAAEAAAALAGRLRKPDRVWTSPLARASQTAKLLGLASEPIEALRDQDFGRWTGKTLADVQRLESDAFATWMKNPELAPHGGESLGGMASRVAPLLDRVMALKGHTVAVTHPAVIRSVIVTVLGAPLLAFWKIDVEPLSLTEFTSDGRRWALRLGG